MTRALLASFLFASTTLSAQTYFYIDQVVVDPQPATTQDVVSIDLIGNLSSSGSYIVSATANVTGFLVSITVVAASTGGLTVLVPHTETIVLGQLPAGTYQVAYSLGSQNVLFPPDPVTFTVGGAGSACDSVDVISVTVHPFTDTAMVVHVANGSSVLFDYPGFILFDENGDTLAVETVNFFGIAGDSWHVLEIHPDATMPNAPFYGVLQLWTDFMSNLACEWMPFIDPCPPGPCTDMFVTIQNLGGALAIGTYGWTLYDDAFQVVSTGQLEMTDIMQYDTDTVCLPPGNYALEVSPNNPPTGGDPHFSVTSAGWISGPSQQVVWSLPVQMPFSYYPLCIDGTNGVEEPMANSGLRVYQAGNMLAVQRMDGSALGNVRIWDAQGRVLHSGVHTTDVAHVDLSTSAGVVIVRVDQMVLRTVVVN